MRDWKSPPADPAKMWLNKSLELQVILACNWRCIACDQGSQFSSFDFVKRGTMTVEQIAHFCGEMIQHNAYLGRIRVMGGEPTVHPQLRPILELLREQLVPHHVGRIEIISNGSRIEKVKELRSAGLIDKARISGEGQKQGAHIANLVHTPASLGYRGRVCNSPWHCGISLNQFGYFPCSSGAGIARFMDDMPRWQRLALPTCKQPGNAVRENWPDLQSLCDHCYHGLREEDKQKCGTSDATKNTPGAHIAPKIEAWKAGKKAEWRTYGS